MPKKRGEGVESSTNDASASMSIAATVSSCRGRKRTIATSPMVFSPTVLPAAKKSKTLKFGFGPGWMLPDADKYEVSPKIRALTAMLAIEGPKQVLCRQIAETEPNCVAVHSNPAGRAGELRGVISNVVMLMPDLKKLWVHFGREICETDCLLDVKMPAIVVYMALMNQVPADGYIKYEPNPELIEQFKNTMIPTLQAIITQWEKRQRDIDCIVVNARRTTSGGNPGAEWADLDKGL
ncbi:unnamed protein product, partial [Mesorhabditis spiculigera]